VNRGPSPHEKAAGANAHGRLGPDLFFAGYAIKASQMRMLDRLMLALRFWA
jgi:hypothetical protein